jgi:outer membrane protein OmpA-like peptidoglycan-associated protein
MIIMIRLWQSSVILFSFILGIGVLHAGCSDKKYLEAEEIYNKAVQAKSPQEKLQLFELAFKTCPSHGNFSQGYYQLAKLYYDSGQKDRAMEWLTEAERFKKALLDDSPEALAQTNLMLSKLYKENGNTEQALIHLNTYRNLKPGRDKELERTLLSDADKYLSVVYKPETVKKSLAIDKAVARKHRAQLNRIEIYFDFGKSHLDDEAKKRLDPVGSTLKDKDFSDCVLVVEGHTDEVSSEQFNCRLGEERAKAVTDYMKNKWALTNVQLIPVSYGKQNPVILREGNSKNDWPNIDRFNRRVVIWNSGSKSETKDLNVEATLPAGPCAGQKPPR